MQEYLRQYCLLRYRGKQNRKNLLTLTGDYENMSPAELHEAHRMSLILQRDEYVKRIAEINDQLKEMQRDWNEKKYLL